MGRLNKVRMEKLSLKWNDFSVNVQKSFQNLRKEEDFFDVTLVGDDFKHVTAHKVVLASSSEYFKMVFSNNKKYFQSHALICLEGLNQSDLNNILDYIYHGELQIYQQNLDRFLGIAKRFKLEGLIKTEEQMVEDFEDADITENIPEEKVLTLQNNCVSNSEKKIIKEGKKEKSVMTVQSLDGQILEELDQEVDESFSCQNDGSKKEKTVIAVQSSDVQGLEELDQKVDESYSWDVSTGWYACHHCSKTFKARHHMKGHVEIHFDLSFPCSSCDIILRSRNSLRFHKQRKHALKLYERPHFS